MLRLAIFQCDWPLQVHTAQLAEILAESGYIVDLFLCNCDSNYADPDDLEDSASVNVIKIKKSLAHKICDKILRLWGKEFYARHRSLIARSIIHKTIRQVSNKDYQYYIAIEKVGLLWAGALSERTSVPTIYYSLELYLEDHPSFVGDHFFYRLRKAERKYHTQARATIIQDPMRAQILGQANQIDKMDWLYMPVSVQGQAQYARSNFFHQKFSLAGSKKILLYFGMLGHVRATDALAEAAFGLPDDFIMIMHGKGCLADINALKNLADGEHLILSLGLVPLGDIGQLVSSAHIGLALYQGNCLNDELTAFASEKIALYCKHGIPFVAFNNKSYRELMESHECGVLINTVDELGQAIARIEKDYGLYSNNALLAFEEFYSFQNNFQTLAKYLS